jgi:hypothetical protein
MTEIKFRSTTYMPSQQKKGSKSIIQSTEFQKTWLIPSVKMWKCITPDKINIQHYSTSQIHTSKTAWKNGKWWRVWLYPINRYVEHRECIFIISWNFLESLENYWELKLIGICKFFSRNSFSKIWSCQMFSLKFLWEFLLFVLIDLATKIIYYFET